MSERAIPQIGVALFFMVNGCLADMRQLRTARDGYAVLVVVLHCSDAYFISTGMIPR